MNKYIEWYNDHSQEMYGNNIELKASQFKFIRSFCPIDFYEDVEECL